MLELQGVPYQELYHPDAYTAQQVAEFEHVSGHRLAKVVVVIADGRFAELILPASRRVDLERVREVLNARAVRLATEEEMAGVFTGSEPGAIPALRHWEDVEVLMDSSMKVKGDVLLQAGTHRDAVRVSFEDWFKLVAPRVESFSDSAEGVPR
jgi:Ala-tRNA(Pro) deacylase